MLFPFPLTHLKPKIAIIIFLQLISKYILQYIWPVVMFTFILSNPNHPGASFPVQQGPADSKFLVRLYV